MNSQFTSIVFLGLLAITTAANCAPSDTPTDCSKVDEILEAANFGQAIVSNEKLPIWTSNEEWAARCAATQVAIKSLRKLNKDCLKSLTQQVFSTILRSREQMLDEACKPEAEDFKQTVEFGKCLKSNAMDEAREAERKALATSVVISNTEFANDQERMQRSCCSVPEGRKAMIKSLGKCGQFEAIMNKHADSYMSEAFSLICSDLSKLNCDKMSPLKLDGVEIKSNSFIAPILKAVKHIDHN